MDQCLVHEISIDISIIANTNSAKWKPRLSGISMCRSSGWTCYAAGLRGVLRKDGLESSSVHANTHASTQDHERVRLFPVQSRANLFGVLSTDCRWKYGIWMIMNVYHYFMVSSAVWLMSGEVKMGPEGWIMMLGTCLAQREMGLASVSGQHFTVANSKQLARKRVSTTLSQ